MRHLKMFMIVATIATIVILIHACGPLPVRIQNQTIPKSSKIITGGFGYKFGEVLDKSKIVGVSYTNNPFAEGYMVKPIINNKEFDYYSVEICKSSKSIYLISGFKIYNSKTQAINKLKAFRKVVEDKYGPLKKLADKSDFYAEYISYGAYQVRLIATPGNFDPPKWGFMITYRSDEHARSCNSLF